MARGGARPGAGRPSGAKAQVQIAELAKSHAKEAMLTLVEIMRDNEAPAAARASAANAVLDRGYGKPAQTVDVTTRRDPGAPVPIERGTAILGELVAIRAR